LFRSDYSSREVSTMTPLPSQTLARLQWRAESGDHEAKALLHLIARADKRDQDVAEFVDSYSSTIAALCRRLEALERGITDLPAPEAPADAGPVANGDLPARVLAMCRQRNWSLDWTCRGAYLHLESSELIEALRGKRGDPKAEAADVLLVLMSITENAGISWGDVLEQVAATCTQLENCGRYSGEEWTALVGDAKGTESDSVADTAQRITDYASKAGLTVQDWANAFNAAPVDDSSVSNALLQAEAALADVAEGEAVSPHAVGCLHWAEARCTQALAAIRPVMRRHGIRTSEFPTAAPAPAPAAPANGLLESIVRIIASDSSEGPESFQGISKDVICELATWLEHQQDCPNKTCTASANYFADLLRDEIR
jgi:NTP pyrophosphatase (non-canonical NTP hydrolase)